MPPRLSTLLPPLRKRAVDGAPSTVCLRSPRRAGGFPVVGRLRAPQGPFNSAHQARSCPRVLGAEVINEAYAVASSAVVACDCVYNCVYEALGCGKYSIKIKEL